MGFEAAIALGCLCVECPLGVGAEKPSKPVLPEIRDMALLLVVGEAPGGEEVKTGMPFVGASGFLLQEVLRKNGLHRGDVSLTNALLCRPPSEFRAFMRVLGARNRARKKKGEKQWPSPVACCRPRLLREVAAARAVLTLGATALAAVRGTALEESGMMRARGFPQEWAP
jgi:uracil-DNA glycosylase family 4